MKLKDLLNKFTNDNFLLTINGICTEWYGGSSGLPHEDYYIKYRDKKVIGIAIISTNMMPELCITIEDEP